MANERLFKRRQNRCAVENGCARPARPLHFRQPRAIVVRGRTRRGMCHEVNQQAFQIFIAVIGILLRQGLRAGCFA